MTPITINLLPDQKKMRLRSLVKFLFTKNLLEIMLLALLLTGLALILCWLIIVETTAGLAETTAPLSRDYFAHNQEVKKINQLIGELETSSRGYTPLTGHLRDISGALPGTVRLLTFHIDRRAGTVQFAGIAQDRAGLLLFKEHLQQLTWLQKVDSPSSELLQKENISFDITGQLKDLPLLPGATKRVTEPTERSSAAPIEP